MIIAHAVAAPIIPTPLAVLRDQGPELSSGDMWREWRLKVRVAA